MDANVYPLHWPDGWPRARHRRQARYRASVKTARDELLRELRLMGAKSIVISSNAPPRGDNTPSSSASNAPRGDPGVAVYFYIKGDQKVVACDQWTRLVDNLRACGLTISALRMIERTGASDLLARAFTGFKALPPAAAATAGWRDVLQFDGCPVITIGDARKAYRQLSRENHPDHGGDAGAMAMINRAWEQAQEELG